MINNASPAKSSVPPSYRHPGNGGMRAPCDAHFRKPVIQIVDTHADAGQGTHRRKARVQGLSLTLSLPVVRVWP